MSKKNIVDQKEVGKAIHLTFKTDDGNVTYEYKGSSAAAIRRGTDPADLTGGRRIEHKKK